MSFFQRISALICITTALFGCSLVSIGGRYADWYVMSRIDNYVDLSKDQRNYLDPRVDEHLAWMKAEVLPDAHKAIGELIDRLERGLSPDDIVWADGRIDFLRTKMQLRFMPDTVWLLSRLSTEQVKHLQTEMLASTERSFETKNSQSPDDFRRERMEKYEERFTDWVDSITSQQKLIIAEMFGEFATLESRKINLAGRAEVQSALIRFTTSPVNEDALRAFISDWFENPAELRSGVSKEYFLKRSAVFRASLLKFQDTLTKDQKSKLVSKLKEYQQDILAFSKSKT